MKENTEKGTSDETEKKSELRSGALRSSLAVELHTRYAILLWEGQHTEKKEKDGRKVSHRRIMGMPYFLHLVNRINEDSLKDDPFADEKMYLLEQEFNRGTGRVERLVTELDNILKNVPARISLSEALSVSPVNISVFSRTPVGYRCVWLLVGFDQLALKAFQASHYGLISHARRDDYLRRGAQSIHRSYGLVQGYRSSGITRRDILQNSSALTEQMASLDEDILLGKKRSSFSPPISKESIALLQSAKNARPESIFRLWMSALDDASIRAALSDLWPSARTEALYYAGVGRSRADWLIGMNLTRLFTLKGREAGIGNVLSVGRVQTPTLAIVVQRDREIENFVAKPYFEVIATLAVNGAAFPAKWVPAAQYCDEEKRCIQPGVVAQVVQLCRQTPTGAVIDCQTERKKQSAPLAFSLSSLQQACSRHWGMPAQTVLDIAQKLYETHKLTSYPRTDCCYLPVSMREEIPQVLSAVVGTDPALQPVVAQLDTQFVSRIWNDKKITAHHGIIPTKHTGDLSKLSDEERNVYQLVRLHYLAQFMPLMEVDATEATFNIGGQLFRTRGNVVVKAGWKSLFGKMADDDEKGDEAVLPAMQAGQVCQVQGAEQKALQTRPPAPYNDGTLIAAMTNAAAFVTDDALKKVLKENAGIGTEATRAGIIDTLVKRGFLVREKKALRSTPLGRSLVDVLPGTLTNPGLTALWEQMLDEVAAGRVSLDDFMAKQSQWVSQLVAQGKSQPLAMQAPPSPRCPVCGGKTSQRKGKNGSFWGCLNYPDCKGIVGDGGNAKALQGRGGSSLPTRLKIKLR